MFFVFLYKTKKNMTRIKEILKEKKLTLNELADKLGVSRQALSKQAKGIMLVETAEKIAAMLDVPLWQLFASPDEVRRSDTAGTVRCPHCGKRYKLVPLDD